MDREVEKTARFVFRPAAARASELRSYLVVREGPDRGARLEVSSERSIVGRGPSAALRLRDPGVSSIHCAVWFDGNEVWVEDLGSSNGSSVDDREISEPTRVGVGSILTVGKSLLRHERRSPEELERESALEADLGRAAAYVAAILPPPITEGPIRVAWRYLPSDRLGGDAFGYRWLDADRFALFVIDVSGHGTEAALHAVSAANALRSGQLAGAGADDPSATLGTLNNAFPMARHGGMYLTAWYGVFDRRDRTLRFAGAGHPSPLVKLFDPASPEARVERLISRNPPIGLAESIVCKTETYSVPPASRLYLFSDGIFEIESDEGRQWRFEDFAEIVARPSIPGFTETARIETDVRAALPGTRFDDDLSLLVIDID